MKKTTLIASVLTLAVSVWLLPAASAEEEGAKISIPATAPGILKEINHHEEELNQTIANKKLEDVHHHAFAIRDLVNALPEKSKDLDAEKLGKLESNAKFVADLATRLDATGDSKDQAGTEANFKKLQSILKSIKALYASGTTSG
jgi:hypothetical protein